MVARGDRPYINYGGQLDLKRLYHSEPLAALKVPITIAPGYGQLEMGMSLAINLSAAGNVNKFYPYNPTSFSGAGAADHPGRAYLVQSTGGATTSLYVTIDDSYKFIVGDDVIINDNETTAENLGAITAIDRTTYGHMAVITVTVSAGGTSFTTARFAYICVEAGTSDNLYSDGVGILEKTISAGIGSDAQGANATLIIGNCVLYTGMLTNVDSAFRTDVSAATIGNYTYIR